ncbi:MAG: T9SS type A sorting domain-containing protein, partial [Saprospiraceae bacterium]
MPTLHAQTYNYATNCQIHELIPDNGCNTAEPLLINFDVNGLPAGARLGEDVFIAEVRVVIEHSFTDDIEIRLTSPFGKTIILSADNGSGQDNYGDPTDISCGTYTSFVPAACNSIVDGSAPFIGAFAPQESFASQLDGNLAAGNWTLAFCDDVPNDIGFLEYAELIFADQACLQPLDVEIVNVDSTTFLLDWFAAGFCENTLIEYGPVGFTPGNGLVADGGTLVMADCPPFALKNLPENSALDIYLRTDCGATISANSCVISATTLCELAPTTLRETFNQQSVCVTDCNVACPITGIWQNDLQDDFDWLVNTGSTPSPNTGPAADADGDGNYLYTESSGTNCRSGNEAVLITECIDINTQGEPDCHFSFQYHAFGRNIDSLKLDVSLDAGANWTNLWNIEGNQGNEWKKQYINLTAYDGQTVRLRFVSQGGNGSESDVALDNLVFYGSQPTGGDVQTYYLDADNDGFGDANISLEACANIAPVGYVLDNTDCNDTNANINPAAEEIPCNMVDENCNGETDDFELLPPLVTDATICSGESGTITSTIEQGDFVFWYDSLTGGMIVFPDFGTGFSFTAPTNSSDTTQIYTFYAEAKSANNFNCQSQPRTPASFIVPPNPQISVSDQPEICSGQFLDLASLNIFDDHNTGAAITFHTNFPPTADNQLVNTDIIVDKDTTFYLAAVSPAGCSDVDSVAIKVKTEVDFAIQQGDSLEICLGGMDTLRLDFALPNGNYDIEWNTGDTTDFLPIAANAQRDLVDRYLVIVTSDEGCQSTDFIYVTTVESIDSVAATVTDVSACSTTDGSIALTPQSGLPPFQYAWSGATNGNVAGVNGSYTIQNLPTGTYSVTVTDNSSAACPRVVNNLVINQPIAEVSIAALRPVSCFAEADGMIEIAVQGDNPTVKWNTGEETMMIDELTADTYSVSVVDNDCETVLDIVLSQPSALQLNSEIEQPRCANSVDGNILLSVLGGTAPFSYDWNNGETTQDLPNVASGDYQVVITDANNCQLTSPFFSVNTPDTLQLQVDELQDVNCFNEDNGRILLTTMGGTAPYLYEWDNGETTEDLTNVVSGNYQLKITDASGCEQEESFQIQNPTPLTISNSTAQNASCPGATDGEIKLEITGGTVANDKYQINWENLNTDTTQLTNLATGNYTVEILDNNNCRIDTTFSITAPDELVINATIRPPLCVGAANGLIDIQLAQPAQSFQCNTRETTNTIRNAADGFYQVDIVDAFGCKYDTSFTLQGRQLFEYQPFVKSPECFAAEDGLINLNFIRGGRPPFSYDWNNGRTTQNIQNLAAGEYAALVTDADGCTYQTDTFNLIEPTALELMVMDSTTINCYGDNSGSAEIQVAGGTGTYRYFWNDNEQSSPSLVDVTAGTYEFLVLDENDCTENIILTFDQPDSLEIKAFVVAPDICNNPTQRVDSIQLLVEGGTPAYEFVWNTGDTIQNLVEVEIGDYEVSVTDQKGCQAELKNIKVSKIPAPITIDSVQVEDISCHGAADGSYSVIFNGGRAPYTYLWSPPLGGGVNTTENGDLSTGNILAASELGYNVTITDVNNCRIVTDFVFVEEPDMITVEIDPDSIRDVSCFGGNDGQVVAEVLGGVSDFYNYQWLESANGEIVDSVANPSNLAAGTYELFISDRNGCAAVNVPLITIDQPASLPVIENITIQNVNCFGGNDGQIELDMNGGIAPYRYRWNNGATSRNINNLAVGGYQLEILDANDCAITSDSFFIDQPETPLLIAEIRIRDESCFGANDGRIEQSAFGGTPPYTYFFDDIPAQENVVTQQLAGDHYLTVVDMNGCVSAMDTVTVRSPDPVVVDMLIQNASASNIADGQAELLPLSGVVPFSYQWEIGDTTNIIGNQIAGTYPVVVKDANGCQLDTFAIINLTTGIQEAGEKIFEKITLFPNPAQDITYLDVNSNRPTDVQIICYNAIGEIMFTKQSSNLTNKTIPLPTENLTAGLYFIAMIHDDNFLYFEK